jgi:hypothetical protein
MGKYRIHTVCNRGEGGGIGGLRQKTPAAKYLYLSIFKKSRQLGFGVFIDFWSMVYPLKLYRCGLFFEQIDLLKKDYRNTFFFFFTDHCTYNILFLQADSAEEKQQQRAS